MKAMDPRAASPGATGMSERPGRRVVLLAAPRGYCAGVERAVEAVERALGKHGAPRSNVPATGRARTDPGKAEAHARCREGNGREVSVGRSSYPNEGPNAPATEG